jgi:TPR repeat protein
MMFKPVLIAAALSLLGAAALPAAAQFYGNQRTDAEIALEQSDKQMAAAKARRDASSAGCLKKDAKACFALGELYRLGEGGAQDHGLAAKAYKQSCDLKNARGCSGLAYLTNYGRGVKQDLSKARTLYEKSCDLGEVSGCAAFGNMLFTGTGGAKNVTRGTELLTAACDRKYDWACQRLVDLGAFTKDRRRAKDFIQ